MTAIADSGFVVAVALRRDQWHDACIPVYFSQEKIYLPQSTLAEAAYLIGKGAGNQAVAHFLSNLTKGRYEVIPLEAVDLQRTAQILERYSDSRIDFVDASLVAVAERLNVKRILTIDRRDFQIVRPRHTDHFELLPQL